MTKEIETSDDVTKKYKELKIIHRGNQMEKFSVRRIPTGILEFDILTRGGIPEGRITEFYGEKSSFKSGTMYKVIGNYLAANPDKKAVLFDYEATFDPEWASAFIKDLDRLIVVVPDYGEQGVNITLDYANTEDVGLIALDSLAMMTPLGISEKNAEEDTMGLHPKLVVKLLRKIIPAQGLRRKTNNPLTMLIINQTIASMAKGGFVATVIKPGGKMKEFMWTLDVKFSYIGNTKLKGIPVVHEYKIKIEKNKLGLDKTEGTFEILMCDFEGKGSKGELLEKKQITAYAKKIGIIERVGSSWKIGENVFKNLAEVDEALKNRELLAEVKRQVLDISLQKPITLEEEGKNESTDNEG